VIDLSKAYAVLQSFIGARKDLFLKGHVDLKGRAVAVRRSTTQHTMLLAIAAEHGFRMQRYEDKAALLTAALTGQADIVATSASQVIQMGLKTPRAASNQSSSSPISTLPSVSRRVSPSYWRR
jgi:polar amino acid transport system substrate-binding protein